MIEFFKNLFRKKKAEPKQKVDIEHYIEEGDIHIYVDRENETIRIEAPAERELSKSEIIDICRKYYEE